MNTNRKVGNLILVETKEKPKVGDIVRSQGRFLDFNKNPDIDSGYYQTVIPIIICYYLL